MTDRIDELQRLHEAATMGPWHRCPASGGRCQCGLVWGEDRPILAHYVDEEGNPRRLPSDQDIANTQLAAAMRNALPALLRVARAAKAIAGNVPLDIDSRIRWLEVQVGREEWAELLAALAELDKP